MRFKSFKGQQALVKRLEAQGGTATSRCYTEDRARVAFPDSNKKIIQINL